MRVLVFIGAIIGALFVAAGLLFSKGAPQEAAAAGMALAFAVIPYVLFRVQATATAEDQRRELIELLKSKQ